MAITLLQLRTQSRQRADMENSEFITDSELNTLINSSIGELHDILIQSYGSDYYINETTFSTTANEPEYSLPADFYKLRGVDAKINGNEFRKVRRFNFNERNRFEEGTVGNLLLLPTFRYRLLGSKIRFSPIPDANTSIRLFYIPFATTLTLDTDTLDDFSSYAEYIIVDTAIKMLQKEESDTQALEARKAALKRRIEEAAQNRDAEEPETVSDITAEGLDGEFI